MHGVTKNLPVTGPEISKIEEAGRRCYLQLKIPSTPLTLSAVSFYAPYIGPVCMGVLSPGEKNICHLLPTCLANYGYAVIFIRSSFFQRCGTITLAFPGPVQAVYVEIISLSSEMAEVFYIKFR